MWQYNHTYLCHANNYKYVDKYRDKRGNWQYVYPDDVPQKARTMSIRNDKPTNALNKGYSGQDYGKSGNTRFANVKDQISLDIKSRAAARENEKKAADKAYRKAAYNSAAAAQEAAERARGEASGKGSQGYNVRDDYKELIGKGGVGAAVRIGKLTSSIANKHAAPKMAGGHAKDAFDYDKAAKTSQMLKAATAKAATSRTDAAQNAREAAIQKSAKQTQAGKYTIANRSKEQERAAYEAEQQKAANAMAKNRAENAKKNDKKYAEAARKGSAQADLEAAIRQQANSSSESVRNANKQKISESNAKSMKKDEDRIEFILNSIPGDVSPIIETDYETLMKDFDNLFGKNQTLTASTIKELSNDVVEELVKEYPAIYGGGKYKRNEEQIETDKLFLEAMMLARKLDMQYGTKDW